MSAMTKFHAFITKLVAGTFASAFNASSDTLKAYLSNVAPAVASMALKADLAEIAAGNGYAAGGVDVQNSASTSAGVITMTCVDFTIVASGGPIGPFRYVVLYDDTAAGQPLLGWWDYGDAITLKNGESFTTDFGEPFQVS